MLICTNQSFLKKFVRKHEDKELVAELMALFTARGDLASCVKSMVAVRFPYKQNFAYGFVLILLELVSFCFVF